MNRQDKEQSVIAWRDDQRRPQRVAMPRPQDGLRRALHGSFSSLPAMPEEFVRLLERIH